MLDWIKSHPYASGGIIIGGFVVFMLIRGGSGDGSTTVVGGQSADEVAAGVALQQIQAQAQGNAASIAGAIQMQENELGTTRYLADLAANLQSELGSAQIQLAAQQTAEEYDYKSLIATLSSGDTRAGIAADVRSDELMSQVLNNQTTALVKMAQINKPKQGLFSKIFG